jgi:hypothetical protein
MAEFSAVYTLVTPAATVLFNSGTDRYRISDIDGLDGAPIRATKDPVPLGDGGRPRNFFLDGREITIRGVLQVESAATEVAYVTARNGMENTLMTALNSILRTYGTLSWTPTGGTLRSLAVRNDEPVQFTGGWLKDFIFGLYAGNPTY